MTYREGVPETEAIQQITRATVWAVKVDGIRLGPVTAELATPEGEIPTLAMARERAAYVYGVKVDAVVLEREYG